MRPVCFCTIRIKRKKTKEAGSRYPPFAWTTTTWLRVSYVAANTTSRGLIRLGLPGKVKCETGKIKCARPAILYSADSINSGSGSTSFVTDSVNSVAELVKSDTDLVKSVTGLVKSVMDVTLFLADSVNCVADFVKSIADLILSDAEFVLSVTEEILTKPSKVTGAVEKVLCRSDKLAAAAAFVSIFGEGRAKNVLKRDAPFPVVTLSASKELPQRTVITIWEIHPVMKLDV